MDMPKGFKVIGDKVLVRADMEPDEDGGIIIPDTIRIHDWSAEVVQVGNLVNTLKVGDTVLYSKNEAVIPFSGAQEYRIIRENRVIAKLVKRRDSDAEDIHPLFGWILCKPEKVVRKIGNIHLPDSKTKKVYGAIVRSVGDDVTECKPGQNVYFDTRMGIECYENDERLCLTHKSDIQLCER